jgi:hypothetical protein
MRIVEGHQKMGKDTHEGQKAESIGGLIRLSAAWQMLPHAAECTGGKGEGRLE